MLLRIYSFQFNVCFCVFCASILFLCTDSMSSCLIFVSSVWASLPEIKRWNGMENENIACQNHNFARYQSTCFQCFEVSELHLPVNLSLSLSWQKD